MGKIVNIKNYNLNTFKKDIRKIRAHWVLSTDEPFIKILPGITQKFLEFGLTREYLQTKKVNGMYEIYWTEKGLSLKIESNKWQM